MVKPNLTSAALLVGLITGFVCGCSVYNPTVVDCALSCSDDGKCPTNMTCHENKCRVAGFSGSCDCNAGTQEVCGGGMGECKTGVRICLDTRIWGPCIGEVRPVAEICDGKDNDCDGMTDESVTSAPDCPLTLGVCANTMQQCIDGGFVDTCGPAAYGPKYEAVERTCDGLDNDCDGNTDALPATRLAQNVEHWVAEALPDGLVIFYTKGTATDAGGTMSTTVHALRLDTRLQQVGNETTVDPGGAIARFTSHAGNAGTVAVAFQRNDGTTGVLRATTAAPQPMLLDFPPGSNGFTWALSVNSAGVVRGVHERDAGLALATWDATSSAVVETRRPFRRPATSVDNVAVTNDSSILAWDGTFDDGGTSDSVGAIEQIEGSTSWSVTYASYATMIPTTNRLQSFRSFSNYIPLAFPIAIDESGLTYCTNLQQLNNSCTTLNRIAMHDAIASGAATVLNDNMITGWLDHGGLYVATAVPNVALLRQKNVAIPGGGNVADFQLVAPPTSGFLNVLFRPTTDSYSLWAVQMCPP